MPQKINISTRLISKIIYCYFCNRTWSHHPPHPCLALPRNNLFSCFFQFCHFSHFLSSLRKVDLLLWTIRMSLSYVIQHHSPGAAQPTLVRSGQPQGEARSASFTSTSPVGAKCKTLAFGNCVLTSDTRFPERRCACTGFFQTWATEKSNQISVHSPWNNKELHVYYSLRCYLSLDDHWNFTREHSFLCLVLLLSTLQKSLPLDKAHGKCWVTSLRHWRHEVSNRAARPAGPQADCARWGRLHPLVKLQVAPWYGPWGLLSYDQCYK